MNKNFYVFVCLFFTLSIFSSCSYKMNTKEKYNYISNDILYEDYCYNCDNKRLYKFDTKIDSKAIKEHFEDFNSIESIYSWAMRDNSSSFIIERNIFYKWEEIDMEIKKYYHELKMNEPILEELRMGDEYYM